MKQQSNGNESAKPFQKSHEFRAKSNFQIDPQDGFSFTVSQAGHGGACLQSQDCKEQESLVPGQPGLHMRPCL